MSTAPAGLTAPPFVAQLDAPTPCASQPLLFDYDATRAERDAARTLCRACPARPACASHALNRPDETGVWGGTSDSDRRRVRADAARAAGQPVDPADRRPCGTPEAYQRHRRLGERCEDCAEGERTRMLARLAHARHGTPGTYELERRLGVPRCAKCLEWQRARSARARAQQRAQRDARTPQAPVIPLRPNGRQTAAQRFEPAA